ncbi:cobalt-precorrin-8 methylmutase [Vibrio viridaestus]|uniref:Cobalt-precorrin-8 methylmutase n=1 Tax=Vibrio viridaestus TaxID=2487322 RepID=A0A3N9TJQ5_9VIBR|nr:cobalt-precorrin-8 methylmutase [Vibrio viridaestus]RQW64559.1 cobalt-precorrin-8 methylmutase [Vibrio viridaestus]
MEYVKQPQKIEEKSFDIISEILRHEYPEHEFSSPLEELITKRVIHTTADFEWLNLLRFSISGLETICDIIQSGGNIYTDTTMALSGINKRYLATLNCDPRCYIAETNVAAIAKEKNITRSMAAVDRALTEGGDKIFVFGNAPTALFRLLENENSVKGRIAVIGVPVGFVGAAESKQALYESDLPYVTALGRKGGSNVAAAIVNAIQYYLRDNADEQN